MAKLRDLRQRKVLSMRELGERSGVSYNTVYRLEKGLTAAHPRTLRKLAAALEVEPSELVKTDG